MMNDPKDWPSRLAKKSKTDRDLVQSAIITQHQYDHDDLTKYHRTQIRLPLETLKTLKEKAKALSVTVECLIVAILREYLLTDKSLDRAKKPKSSVTKSNKRARRSTR